MTDSPERDVFLLIHLNHKDLKKVREALHSLRLDESDVPVRARTDNTGIDPSYEYDLILRTFNKILADQKRYAEYLRHVASLTDSSS